MRHLTAGQAFFMFSRTILAAAVVLAVGVSFESARAQTAPPAVSGLLSPVAPHSAGAQPAPIIHVENLEHDFGDVWSGPDVEHAFTVYNRGDANLEILGVQVDCGCTLVREHPKVIAPGQSGQFPVALKTSDFNGKIVPKKMVIRSNDPVTPQLTLGLLGTFKKRIQVAPAAAAFGVLIVPESQTRVIQISNNSDEPLELKLRPFESEQFKVELAETEPGKKFEFRVSTVVPYKPGFLHAVAMLDTNVPDEKPIRIQAAGRVPARLDLDPAVSRFVVPAKRAGEQTHGLLNFHLNNYGASLVNVHKASVDDPTISTTVDCRSPGKHYWIQVSIPYDTVIPAAGRILTVETDDPEMPKIEARIIPPARPADPPPQTPAQQPTKPTQTQPAAPRPAELMVGRPAPPFELTTYNTRKLATQDLAEKVTILNFVSPTCGFCKRQIPELEKIRQTYEDKGVRFVNVVNTVSRGKTFSQAEVVEFMNSLESRLEIAADPQSQTGRGFQVTSYPTCVVLGKDGRVAAVNIGANKVQLVPAQLDTLLAGKSLPAAPQPTQ